MRIKWNKVTWYSKLLAVVLFVLTFYIAFVLGYGFQKEAGNEKIVTSDVNANNGTPSKIPQKQSVSDKIPTFINTQDIKEEFFSGKMPIIPGSSPLSASARVYVLQIITEFRAQAKTDVPDMRKKFGADSPISQYTIDIEAKYVESDKTESIVLSVYAYTGGANGNSSFKVITASLSDGKNPSRILSLSDIIKDDKRTAFTEFVKKELNDWRPPGSDAPVIFPDEVNNLKFNSFANWSLDGKNLTLYFDKYEIGPGYLGAVAFPIPLGKIKDFLK